MPPDISGLSRLRAVPSLLVRTAQPAEPSTAIVPVEPIRRESELADALPLGRSGVNLLEVLETQDAVRPRAGVVRGAVEVALEQARSALVRRQPAEVLAALDPVWAKAQASEEGWYLRAGALIASGLPVEGDEVAEEALQRQPQSLALRLAQSVARAVMGDLAGAREALAPALDRAPEEPLLQAYRAVLVARQGRHAEARSLLERLAGAMPEHPAVRWGQQAVRTLHADAMREPARGPVATVMADVARETVPDDVPASKRTTPRREAGGERSGDLTASSFRQLGASALVPRSGALQQEARMLVRAFSSGGTMATVGTPEQAHAARSVLVALIGVLSQEAADVAPPGPTIAQLLPLLREGRTEEARRQLRREGEQLPVTQRRLIEAFIDGGVYESADASADAAAPARSRRTPADTLPVVQSEPEVRRDQGPLTPLRMGLALLLETPATRAALVSGAEPFADGRRWRTESVDPMGTGWGSALAAWSGRTAGGKETAGLSMAPLLMVLIALVVGIAASPLAGLLAGAVAAGVASGVGAMLRGRSPRAPRATDNIRSAGRAD